MEKVLYTLRSKMIMDDNFDSLSKRYEDMCDYEKNIDFVLNAMLDYNVTPSICGDTKNAERSKQFREEGNKVYKSLPFTNVTCVEALKLYTKSITYAPYPSEELAMAYANRSAVLKRLHLYKECIGDVDLALALPYPDNLKHKLYERKIECLSIVQPTKLDAAIKETRHCMRQMSLNNTVWKQMNNTFASAKKSSVYNKINDQTTTKQLPIPQIETSDKKFPSASSAITIKYNEKYGRHVVATRDLQIGELIAVEKPYSQMVKLSNAQTHCSQCLEISWANIPCNYCTYAMYCSETCKALDWEKCHDIECPVAAILFNIESIKFSMLALKMVIQMVKECKSIEKLRETVKEVDNWSDPLTQGVSEDGVFTSDSCRSVLSLKSNIEELDISTQFRRSCEIAIVTYYIATRSNMFGSPLKDLSEIVKNPDVAFIGGVLLRNILIISTNGHSLNEERDGDTVERGYAVMPFFSLFNHSCHPNTTRSCFSTAMTAYVTYPIKEGEQVFDNYGQLFAIMPKCLREMELQEQYKFKCQCVACEEDWPLSNVPQTCKELVNWMKNELKLNFSIELFVKYSKAIHAGQEPDKSVLDYVTKLIQIVCKLRPSPCSYTTYMVVHLRHAYCLLGNKYSIPNL